MSWRLKQLRKITTSVAPISCVLFFVAFLSSAAILNQVVAVVNGDIITEKELEQLLRPLYSKYKNAYSDQQLIQKIGKARVEALEQLIDRKLITQEAKRQAIEATEKEIDRRLRKLKSRFDDEEMFYYAMSKENINIEEIRENLKEQIMVQKLTRQELTKNISITPKEVGDYYHQHSEAYHDPAKVLAHHILVKKSLTNNDAKTKLAVIQKALEKGDPFEMVAKEYSEGPKASEGGDLGFFAKGKLLPEIEEQAFQLNVGEISEVIETELGYHLVMVKARKKERTIPLSEVYTSIQEKLRELKIKEARVKWLKRLRAKAHIEVYI